MAFEEKGGMKVSMDTKAGDTPGQRPWVFSPLQTCAPCLVLCFSLAYPQPELGATVNKMITSISTEATQQAFAWAVPQSPPTTPDCNTSLQFAAHCASSGTKIAAFWIVICHTESALATPPLVKPFQGVLLPFNPRFLVHKGGSAAFIRCVCLLPRTTLAPVYDQIPSWGHSGKFLLRGEE